jgi:hypothetical protein
MTDFFGLSLSPRILDTKHIGTYVPAAFLSLTPHFSGVWAVAILPKPFQRFYHHATSVHSVPRATFTRPRHDCSAGGQPEKGWRKTVETVCASRGAASTPLKRGVNEIRTRRSRRNLSCPHWGDQPCLDIPVMRQSKRVGRVAPRAPGRARTEFGSEVLSGVTAGRGLPALPFLVVRVTSLRAGSQGQHISIGQKTRRVSRFRIGMPYFPPVTEALHIPRVCHCKSLLGAEC